MADKNTGVGREHVGMRSDEDVTGRERTGAGPTMPSAGERQGSYTAAPSTEATADARTREIRKEIEQTRGDMSETVDAIQDRLRPSTVASNAAESVKHAASERMRGLADSESVNYVRSNPVPTAMVGIGIAGLAWLAFGGRGADRSRGRSRASRDWRTGPRYYEADDYYRASGAYTGYESPDAYGAYGSSEAWRSADEYDRERGTAARPSARTSGMTDEMRRRAEQTTRRARQSASRAQSQLQRTWNESPLLIGAAVAVLGALVGMAVPETERENEWMGETRDNMIEGVQHTVKEKVEEVQNVATKAASEVQSAVGISTDQSSTGGGDGQLRGETQNPTNTAGGRISGSRKS